MGMIPVLIEFVDFLAVPCRNEDNRVLFDSARCPFCGDIRSPEDYARCRYCRAPLAVQLWSKFMLIYFGAV